MEEATSSQSRTIKKGFNKRRGRLSQLCFEETIGSLKKKRGGRRNESSKVIQGSRTDSAKSTEALKDTACSERVRNPENRETGVREK